MGPRNFNKDSKKSSHYSKVTPAVTVKLGKKKMQSLQHEAGSPQSTANRGPSQQLNVTEEDLPREASSHYSKVVPTATVKPSKKKMHALQYDSEQPQSTATRGPSQQLNVTEEDLRNVSF